MITKEELFSDLNPQQREAVEINSGSLLVFAGAGSGKTRVITTKIAYAITQLGVKPYEILAVTFTNKACREMKERVESFIGEDLASQTVIRTFHSFGVWLLRKYGHLVGLAPDFTIYDDKDSAQLLAQCFPNDQKKDIDQAAKQISMYKDKMSMPPESDGRLCAYYEAYQHKLEETGNVDFADMIIKSIELLKKHEEVKQYIHNRFSMILVDEYQDSNTAQYILLQQLVGPSTFVCVVGDDDQSIYRFRGAQVKNILNFPKVFPNTKTVVLGKNYRCTQSILEVAKDVIQNNKSRAEKELCAEKSGGLKPRLYYVNSEFDEAQQVINLIKQGNPDNCAVIYRTNAQSKAFEDRLIMNGIPYHIVGSLRFYDREEIRDSIALFALLSNPRDTVAFQRMVNKPPRGIGDVSIGKIVQQGGDMIAASRDLLSDNSIKGKAAEGLKNFVDTYENCRSFIDKEDNSDLLKRILRSFGIMEYYVKRDEDEHSRDSSRVENLNQLVNMLTSDDFSEGMDGIHNFLEYIALDPSALGTQEGSNESGVTLITMHNTKGLEYDRVFVVGMEDEIFPSLREGSTNEDLEEERRICYVAMTRARKELYLFSASQRMVWGRTGEESPSRFLSEIKPSHIEIVDQRFSSRKSTSDFGFGSYNTYGFPRREKSTSYINTRKRDTYDDWTPQPKVQLVKKAVKSEPKEVIDWKVGDRVNSQLMGPGTVTSMKMFGNREVMVVTFDSGKMGTFVKDKADFTRL